VAIVLTFLQGFGDTLLDALDGSFCTYSAFGQKGNNNSVDPVYPDVHASEPEGYKGIPPNDNIKQRKMSNTKA
jgi:hypothetical protein